MDINEWAEELTKEVYTIWKTKYRDWEHGFKVFYSPIRRNPKLMIISLNPGGTVTNFKKTDYWKFKKGNFSLPPKNRYLVTDYPFAKKIREFFDGNEGLLDTSVAISILFFRSKNFKFWLKNVPKTRRTEMENYSYEKVKLIIKTVKPQAILVISSKTYKRLGKILEIKNEKQKMKIGKVTLVRTAFANGIPIFSIPHLTGYHISTKNIEKMRNLFKEFTRENNYL